MSRWQGSLPPGKLLLGAVLATVVVQIAAMAATSRFDAHPDEKAHVAVADYYVGAWVPPGAGDPRVIPSLSKRGFSYHYNVGIVYFLAGKAAAPVAALFSRPFAAFRLFNVALFVLLAVSALRRREPTAALLLLLFPAQVWYLFSYFNDDALALTVCLFCCWQVMDRDAPFARFLSAEDWTTGRRGALLVAVLLAALVLSKKNYYLFLLFLVFYAGWTIASSGGWIDARRLALKWGLVALLALGFASPRVAADRWVNDPAGVNQGLTKRQMIEKRAELYARPGFKPSELGTAAAFHQIRMKDRGMPLAALFAQYRWHELTAKSFFGLYGYMSILSDPLFYLAMGIAYGSFLLSLGLVVWRHTRSDGVFCLIAAGFCGVLVLLSVHNSWTVDFQPQGRYLFPAFGILFAVILKLRAIIPRKMLWQYGILIWLLSSYSFIATGLRLIPK